MADERDQWIQRAVAEYERPLMQYATHLLRNAESARDVVQDAFFRLCRQNFAELDGHLAEWLYTVTRNRAMDVLRKEKRMRPLTSEHIAVRPAADPGPQAPAEQRDDLSAVMRAIGDLPDKQQEVVRLKFQQNLTYRQIAAVTGHSLGNVGYLLHTALNTLRKQCVNV